jgi:hypothetical protein
MTADAVAPHLQNLYLVCGTAIPVLFVALAVQTPAGVRHSITFGVSASLPSLPGLPAPPRAEGSVEVPVAVQSFGLVVMLIGEIAALAALGFDWKSVLPGIISAAGVLAGALFVAANVAPAPTAPGIDLPADGNDD